MPEPTLVTPSASATSSPTDTPYPPTPTTDPTEVFVTMVMSTKYAARTEYAAIPTPTSTPTIPAGSPACQPEDLKASFNTNGAGGHIAIGIEVLNKSNSNCFVPAYPAVQLTNRAGEPLDISYDYLIPNENPTTVQPSEEGQPARYGLKAGQQAVALLSWGNWCKGVIPGGLIVRLPLLDKSGDIDIPTDLTGGGHCDEPEAKSTVDIMPFETYLNP
jgi:hypothetical protein